MHCRKCLTGRSGDKLGDPCRTPGCDGVVEEDPPFSSLVDELPEPMRCPRRDENCLADRNFPGPDCWQKFKSNGNRVCSFCGSLHPEDFLRLVKEAAETPENVPYQEGVSIEQSDKGYKIYVHQPGVRNASEGGIKFYTMHLPRKADGTFDVTEEQQEEFVRAKQLSRRRFDIYLSLARCNTLRS